MKIILIGTSPAMLIEAILLRHEHKTAQIEIHDKNNLPGGSWRTTSFSKIKFIETGSHIFAPWKSRNLYNECSNILKNKFRLKLYFLKPKPLNILNKNISKSELKKIDYYYIQGGAGRLLKLLLDIIKKKKIKIIYNSLIKQISIFDKKKKIQINKNYYFADQVYIPHYCKINLNFFKENNNYILKESTHIIIKFSFNCDLKNKISYMQKVNFSKLFDRLSYLSDMNNLQDHIFCLRLSELAKKKFKENKKLIVEKIKKDLIKFLEPKFQKKNNFKVHHKLIKYETSYRNKDQLKQLNFFARKNKVKLVDTSEFIKYMSKNIHRLKALQKL
ncbi:hypothetical protein N9H11_03015 [Candidatus Pelagibacter ubique]|nr:hypothetical protein [Candidatus Pelagibacter ubique]